MASRLAWISNEDMSGESVWYLYADYQYARGLIREMAHLMVWRTVWNGQYKDFPATQFEEAKAYVEAMYALTMDV